jgi:valyl-tRNA synthetase
VSEEAFRQGNRLVTKLWNAARFVLMHAEDTTNYGDTATWRLHGVLHEEQSGAISPQGTPQPTETPDPSRPVSAIRPQSEARNVADRWLLARLRRTVERATAALDSYELSVARSAIERFFWSDFCDTYLELIKYRLDRSRHEQAEQDRAAAVTTARSALLAVLKLLALYLPHVTDEIYLQGFQENDGAASIHVARWPEPATFPEDEAAERAGEAMLKAVEAVRRWKAERNLSVGAPVGRLTITCPAAEAALLREMALVLQSISRACSIIVELGETVSVHVEEGLPAQL